jgi:cytidylate kinase
MSVTLSFLSLFLGNLISLDVVSFRFFFPTFKLDADKLQKGIDFAKSKGVIDPHYVPEPYITVDVLGKTPDQVAQSILNSCGEADLEHGTVIVLVGLSGTGKGTTVSKLQSSLENRGKKVVCWSNGNIFRSVTLLAVTWCDQHNDGVFDVQKACTPDNLKQFMSMLSFGATDESAVAFDTKISGMGLELQVSHIQNTLLKAPNVASNIPAVAEYTQGEVILFAAQAVTTLCEAGIIVLLEGREQTVNYVRTPHRFSLVLSDESLIGKRRAAQRIMASALHRAQSSEAGDDVTSAVDETLAELVQGL